MKYNKRKSNFKKIICYLVKMYYLNPNIKFNKKEFNCFEKDFLKIIINDLKNKNYLKYMNKSKNKFKISFDGFLYLEEIKRKADYESDGVISFALSVAAFSISVYALWNNPVMIVLGTAVGVITLFIIWIIYK